MSANHKNTYTGISLAILAAIIWSGNFIIAKKVTKDIGPVSLAFFRWLTATIIIFPFAFKYFIKEWKFLKQSWQFLLWVAVTGIAIFNTFVYIGAHYTSAINLTLIGTTTSPIVATILARIYLKEDIGWLKLMGLIFCIAGVLFLLSGGNFEHLLHLHFSTGDLWALAAAFSFAIYNTLVKKRPSAISPLNFLFTAFLIGTILLTPFYIWEKSYSTPVNWNTNLFLFIIYLGLGTSVICFWIWNIAINKIGASRTILFGNLIPIFGTTGSVIFLHEQFTWVHVVSMIMVFTGIVLANLRLLR